MPRIEDYMRSIFAPLSDAANRTDLLPVLKTSDLPAERREDQYHKLPRLRFFDDEPLPLINSRFLGRFSYEEKVFFCLQCEGLGTDRLAMLDDVMSVYDCYRDILDEATFLFLSHYAKPYYSPKLQYLTRDAAYNELAISELDSSYSGHDIDDVVSLYEDVIIYSIPRDSVLYRCHPWFIPAYLACSMPDFRSQLASDFLARELTELLQFGNVNPEILYYSVTSLHRRQFFMETYKTLEAIFYLPWVHNLKHQFGYSSDGLTIARQLKSSVRWRQKEKDSIEELFELVDEHIVKSELLHDIPAFADIRPERDGSRVFGRRI